jgi:hypothetical protein
LHPFDHPYPTDLQTFFFVMTGYSLQESQHRIRQVNIFLLRFNPVSSELLRRLSQIWKTGAEKHVYLVKYLVER